MSEFARTLIAWQKRHGRHDLPWQQTRDPYRVWLSEIMLQQTQVDTVIPYYLRFLEHFPDVASLAAAPLDDVLALWSGLGYYARARNLHRAAVTVMEHFGGAFPRSSLQLAELPGIGRSTAAAIASFCFGEQAAILDGNVKRVLCRHFGVEGFPGERAVEQKLWDLAESLLPAKGIEVYPQALMDLGATLCTRSKPTCLHCPVMETCVARKEGRQGELPASKPRKAVPRRTLDVLVLVCKEAVLLESRPATGIWGGLFSLPEVAEGETPEACALRRFDLDDLLLAEQGKVLHSFTHFHLTITPWRGDLAKRSQIKAEGVRWVSLNELDSIGLPAPIRKMLGSLQD